MASCASAEIYRHITCSAEITSLGKLAPKEHPDAESAHLDCNHEGMSKMQRAGHIGGRDDNHKVRSITAVIGLEEAALPPP